MKPFLKNSLLIIIVLGFATFLSYLFTYFEFQEATIIIIYMLAVIIISQTASHYMYGFAASLISVLAFNFFFTHPLYTFNVSQPDYIFTFFVMFIASFLSSSLTSKLKTEKTVSQETTKQVLLMDGINHAFQTIPANDALNASARIISDAYHANVLIDIAMEDQKYHSESFLSKDVANSRKTKTPILLNGLPIGHLQLTFAETVQQKNLTSIANVLSQNLEKLDLIEKQNKAELKIREQKLRNDLLGAISHDLRTPLATIIGSSDTLIENQSKLSSDNQALLLNNIKNDATWLINSVENILSFMRVEEGLHLTTHIESVEELFGDVLARVISRVKTHIYLDLPHDPIYFPMDIQLMEKVLLNLIDNAMKYSSPESKIILKAYTEVDHLFFEVIDQGQGIPDEEKGKIFDRFYTYKSDNQFNRKGLGLGLAICRSIVEAHQGRIIVKDNKPKGTIMRCVFPYKGEKS